MKTANKFKSKGQRILGSSPHSMKDFLEDKSNKNVQMHKTTESQKRNYSDTQNHKYTVAQKSNDTKPDSEKVERIHVQIKKELSDKLIELVYFRKRNQNKEATRRKIIEQALEEYFKKNRPQ